MVNVLEAVIKADFDLSMSKQTFITWKNKWQLSDDIILDKLSAIQNGRIDIGMLFKEWPPICILEIAIGGPQDHSNICWCVFNGINCRICKLDTDCF